MTSSAPPQPPPTITMYRNGDQHFGGKKIVVNRRYYRNFENFLDRVTSDTRSRIAIRKIHTPSGGTKVNSFEKLKNGAVYVAAGPERFSKLHYGEVPKFKSLGSSNVQPVSHSKITATSRYKQEAMAEPLKNRIIFVYKNGEEKTPAMKLLLDKRTLSSMDNVLQFIGNKVNLTSGAVKSIYSNDTCMKVLDVGEIRTGMSYVAVGYGKHFVKLNYSLNSSFTKNLSPRNKPSKLKELKKVESVPLDSLPNGLMSSLSAPDNTFQSIINDVMSPELKISDENTTGEPDTNLETSMNAIDINDSESEKITDVDNGNTTLENGVSSEDVSSPKISTTPNGNEELSSEILMNDIGTPEPELLHESSDHVLVADENISNEDMINDEKGGIEVTDNVEIDVKDINTDSSIELNSAENVSVEHEEEEAKETVSVADNSSDLEAPDLNDTVEDISSYSVDDDFAQDKSNDDSIMVQEEEPSIERSLSIDGGDLPEEEELNSITQLSVEEVGSTAQESLDVGDTVPQEEIDSTTQLSLNEEDSIPQEELDSAAPINLDGEDIVPQDESDNTAQDEPGLYKASGLLSEEGEQVRDNKETFVEKTIDMLQADEVEENLDNENEENDTVSTSEEAKDIRSFYG